MQSFFFCILLDKIAIKNNLSNLNQLLSQNIDFINENSYKIYVNWLNSNIIFYQKILDLWKNNNLDFTNFEILKKIFIKYRENDFVDVIKNFIIMSNIDEFIKLTKHLNSIWLIWISKFIIKLNEISVFNTIINNSLISQKERDILNSIVKNKNDSSLNKLVVRLLFEKTQIIENWIIKNKTNIDNFKQLLNSKFNKIIKNIENLDEKWDLEDTLKDL